MRSPDRPTPALKRSPVRQHEQRGVVDLGEARIAYRRVGEGPPVVLIHGLCGSTRWWAKTSPALARSFEILMVDLIGFGESRRQRPFLLHAAAGQLLRWFDHLGVERASLVGHSMGGIIAADLAADHPERVERLVLADAPVIPFGHGRLRHAVGLLRSVRATPIRFYPVLTADAMRAGPITLWSAANQLLTADLRPKLDRIQTPTLLVWGERDMLVPPVYGQQLATQMPHAEFVTIPGGGHNPMWDRPAAFNQALLAFLQSAQPTFGTDLGEAPPRPTAPRGREHAPRLH